MKKNNTAEKTIRNAEKITEALKESTQKSLRDIMNEAISNLIKEDDEKDEPKADDEDIDNEESYDVEDVDTDVESQDGNETPDEEGENEAEDAEDADDDEWSDLEQYKVGDNDYDFTGVDGETALKVYNKLGDDDQIFVKKDENGNYEVKDEETGAEYVIELDADPEADDSAEEPDADFGFEADNEPEYEIEFGGDDEEAENDENEFDVEFNDEDGDEDTVQIEVDDNDEDDEENLNEENLGYTTKYQKDTAMTLPSDSKQGDSRFDAGAPKGGKNAQRPYGKVGDSTPFDNTVNECGDAGATPDLDTNLEEDGSGFNSLRRETLSRNYTGKGRKARLGGDNSEKIQEAAKRIFEKAKEIQAENKKYAECIEKLKKSIYEAATLNVNMGQVIKLLVNETTTANEKKSILERFNTVKTIKEGKMLYENIKRELNENKGKTAVVLENQISAKSSKSINETTIYQNKLNNPSLDLMERMDNLFK